MTLKSKIVIFVIISQMVSLATISVSSAPGGDIENPKAATIGVNTGNISSNAAGGRYFFNFSIEPDKSYDFQLVGDTNTKFDLFFFDISFLPSTIVDESAEYADTSAYPVAIEGYTSEDSWILIQVFSNYIDGGIGDFTLSISELNTQSPSGSTALASSSNTNPAQGSDGDETPAFEILLAVLTMISVTAVVSIKRT